MKGTESAQIALQGSEIEMRMLIEGTNDNNIILHRKISFLSTKREKDKNNLVTKPEIRNQPPSIHYDAFLVMSVASADKLVAKQAFVLGS